ncbi:MAG: type IV pili methyl-accepting chemotaxis transducer N-terminal domain-containing protein [Pseudomonadota bacterium]
MGERTILERRDFGKMAGYASLAAAAGLAATATNASAAQDISHKIKIAGELRTFVQRMALATAFVKLDVDRKHFLEVLTEEFELFNADIQALKSGDPKYAMPAEDNKLVLEAIGTVEIGWKVLGPQLKDVIDAGDVDAPHFTKIEKVNGHVLALTDSLLHRIMHEYKSSLPLELAYQIDVAGVQQMLSQKMIKEAILVALEFEADKHHDMLVGSMQLFDFGMDKLNGIMLHNEVMLPKPTDDIQPKLDEAKVYWEKLQPILHHVDQAHRATNEELAELARESDILMDIYGHIINALIERAAAV